MNKRYIFLTLLMFTAFLNARPVPQTHEDSAAPGYNRPERGSVIAATLYRTITPTMLKNGFTINRPGSYVFVSATTIPTGTNSTQHAGSINASSDTTDNGVILITSDNVTLNMNGTSLKTDKANLVAVYVNKDLKNITIENGSFLSGSSTWNSAIIVGQNCSNIVLRDLNVVGCTDSSNGAINFKGDFSPNITENITVENVKVLGQASASTVGIRFAYVNSLDLNNVRSNNASTSGNYDAFLFSNCKNVTGVNLQADHNVTTVVATLKGFNVDTCNDVSFDNASASNNTSAGNFDGMYFAASNNITLSNAVTDTNTSIAEQIAGFNFASAANNVKLHNISSSKNSGATRIFCLSMTSIKNAQGSNFSFNNNAPTSATSGCALKLVTCNDLDFTNILASNNAATSSGEMNGISLNGCKNVSFDRFEANNCSTMSSGILTTMSANSNISISNSSISNCSATGTFVGINLGFADRNVVVRNCLMANNTSESDFNGVKDSAGVKNLVFDNLEIVNNEALNDINGFYLEGASGVAVSNCNVSHNSVSGDAGANVIGFSAITAVTNLSISNSNFSFNTLDSSNTAIGGLVAGLRIQNVDGVRISNCKANNNTGSGRAYGFHLESLDNAKVANCHALKNSANTLTGANTDTDGIEALPSAGFYVLSCNYCEFENCVAKSNLAGNYARGGGGATDIIQLAASCSGFGFINIGTSNSARNVGNVFRSCETYGNGTQLNTTISIGGGSYNGYINGTTNTDGLRYELSEAVAGGFADQWGQGTEFNKCTANNNGLQNNLISYGFLTTNSSNNKSVSVNVTNCSASNNWFFGFCDDGAQQSTRLNSETTYTGCYAAMNGQQNSNATNQVFVPVGGAASDADGHIRNFYMHFTDNGQYSPIRMVSYGNQDFTQIPGNKFFNISLTFEA